MTSDAARTDGTTAGPPPSREERKQFKRRRLLAAAQATFAEQGFAATSIDMIAARAEVGRQTFYHYFRNKNEVLEALIREPSDFGLMALEALTRISEPTRAQLEEYVRWQLSHFVENRTTYEIIVQAQAVDPTIFEVAQGSRARFVEVLGEYLQGARRRAGRPVSMSEARVEAELLQSQVEYFFHLWIVRGWEADLDSVVAVLTDTWYAALSGAEPEDLTPAARASAD